MHHDPIFTIDEACCDYEIEKKDLSVQRLRALFLIRIIWKIIIHS